MIFVISWSSRRTDRPAQTPPETVASLRAEMPWVVTAAPQALVARLRPETPVTRTVEMSSTRPRERPRSITKETVSLYLPGHEHYAHSCASDTAGDGGTSISGDATGGNGSGTGSGGSAKSGNSGNADGGSVVNEATGESEIINDGTSKSPKLKFVALFYLTCSFFLRHCRSRRYLHVRRCHWWKWQRLSFFTSRLDSFARASTLLTCRRTCTWDLNMTVSFIAVPCISPALSQKNTHSESGIENNIVFRTGNAPLCVILCWTKCGLDSDDDDITLHK